MDKKMSKNFWLFLILISCMGLANRASAQYPTVPDSIKAASEALMAEGQRHSDSAWQLAYPIVQEEARHGKPYVPWAARPTDLPQSSMLAFPGAEGGGAHSFGGRGGKVYVVTSLADSGPGTLR